MASIPLCVPFDQKEKVRRAGARWDRESRAWRCDPQLLETDAWTVLKPFVPRIYRPDLSPPYVRPWMVPQTLWGKNLRALLPKEQWDVVRRAAYAASGYRCLVCGDKGPQWPVEADEAWHYDDDRHLQTLRGVIALCPDCHHIRHWGKTMVDGNEPAAFERLLRFNRWTRAEGEAAVEDAFDQWEKRSRHEWSSDYSWVTRKHGFIPDEEGKARAEQANQELVAKAAADLDRLDDPMDFLLRDQPFRDAAAPTVVERPQQEAFPSRGFLKVLINLIRG